MGDIWRPFKRENYRYAWNDHSPITEGTDEKTCHEDTCTKNNPYEAEFDRMNEEFERRFGMLGEKLMTDEEKYESEHGHGLRVHFANELPEYKEMWDKYFDEDRKISEYREKCKDEAFALFTKYFYHLWD